MSDFQFLVIALTLLYLSECLVWVRRGSVVFRAWWGRRAAVQNPSPGLGAKRTGVVGLNPLPPFGRVFIGHVWPIAMTADAACSLVPAVINGHDRPDHLAVLLRWDDMWKIQQESDLILINQKPFVRCNGEPLATHVTAALRKIHAARPQAREAEITRLTARAASTQRIRRHVQRYDLLAGGFGGMRFVAHLLFLVIFGAVTVTIGLHAARPFLLQALILLVGMVAIQASGFFFAHRRLFPAAVGARWRLTLTMIFTPTAGIRACDALSRDLLTAFHPLAIALVICKDTEKRGLARRMLKDARHPMLPMYRSDDASEHAVVDAWRIRTEATLLLLIEEAGLPLDDLLTPPAAQDINAKAYCPRCDGEFVVAEGVCDHCGGVALQPLAPGAAVSTQ